MNFIGMKSLRSKGSALFILMLVPFLSFSQEKDTISKSKPDKKVTFAAMPIINYNRSIGFIAGAMTSGYYKINKNDTISPSSSTMLVGMYSTSSTYMALAVQKLYLNEDRWRINYILGTGDIYFQFFAGGDGTIIEEGRWIDYNTSVDFMLLDIKRQLIKNLYIGLEGTLNKSNTVYEVEDPIYEENPTSKANLNSLGYNFLYDSRDHVNFPTEGFFIQYKNSYVREAFGATEKFDQFEIAANYFWDIKNNGNSILVSRAFADIASGDVPFEGQNIIGRDDLRGYSEGKYRGNQVYAVQAELRQHLYKKLGMVGFLGIGAAVDEISEIGDALMLPSIGFGVRYLMIGKEKINIGFDVGFGRDDWSLSFRIGETFGR